MNKIQGHNNKPRSIVDIEFSHVFFKYENNTKYIIQDVSFIIKAGETVGIVGANGSGKSTLIKLMMRLYDPLKGQIFLNGIELKEYVLDDIYSMISPVFQDHERYPESIKQTIQFGNLDEDNMEQIKLSSQHATADSFIKLFPKQYNTNLTRLFDGDGEELSIGQWQKLAIARAFYKDSCIQIYDEPTASIDAISESKIFEKLIKKEQDKIKVIITHKFEYLAQIDKILVLDKGVVVGYGSHNELMKVCPIYLNLFNKK